MSTEPTRPATRAIQVLVAACCLLVAGQGAGAADVAGPVHAQPSPLRYQSPVRPLAVVRAFSPPATPYGPGHLGVDLATTDGASVYAAAAGVVSFVGPVAGRGVVVIAHRDGIRTEYEPVSSALHKGQAVVEGEEVGTLSGRHPGCVNTCLHWGARRGESYLDPLSLLRPLGIVRLLPTEPGH